jgi:hypothetical protein
VGLRESIQAKEQAGERCERTTAAMHAPERNEKSMPPLLLSHLSLSLPLLFFQLLSSINFRFHPFFSLLFSFIITLLFSLNACYPFEKRGRCS